MGSDSSAPDARALELSDFYRCPEGCGLYERVRLTHRLRHVDSGDEPAVMIGETPATR